MAGVGSQGMNQAVSSSSITSLLCPALLSNRALRSSTSVAGLNVGGGGGGDFGSGEEHEDTMKAVRSKRISERRVHKTTMVSPVLIVPGATHESPLLHTSSIP